MSDEPDQARRRREERFEPAPLDGPLLEVVDLKTAFQDRRAAWSGRSTACRFSLERGKTLGVVGESGSGKTVLSRSHHGPAPEEATSSVGPALVRGPRPRRRVRPRAPAALWGAEMAMVFQDPMTSLNPVMKIGNQITEIAAPPPRHHEGRTPRSPRSPLLQSVGIPEAERRLREYPHQMSGGMRQRVIIADRDRLRPEAALRRRAHHRARRDRAGPDPRPAPGAAARALHGDDPRHPRPRRRRRPRPTTSR